MSISLYPNDSLIRRAVRILFVLYFCNDSSGQMSMFDENLSIESESKLQKIEFWIRYPDHLAVALLRGCEMEGFGSQHLLSQKDEVKEIVLKIFRDQEPHLRWVPMLKYLRGAYEPLDDVMCFLSSRSLAYSRVVEGGKRVRYLLMPKGSDAVKKLLRECEETKWYEDRCKLINSFFGHLSGFEIRKLQYLEETYANAHAQKMIARVEAEVYRRFEKVFGEPLYDYA